MITAEHVVKILNEALALDYDAVYALVENRVPTAKFIDHPTIQVMKQVNPNAPHYNEYVVGLIGILNGLFPVSSDGYGVFAAKYSSIDDRLIEFIIRDPEKNKVIVDG
jgi:hypothetical protein